MYMYGQGFLSRASVKAPEHELAWSGGLPEALAGLHWGLDWEGGERLWPVDSG